MTPTKQATVRPQFSLSALLLVTALVALYTAAFFILLRSLAEPSMQHWVSVPIALAAIMPAQLLLVRRGDVRKLQPIGIDLTANITWKNLTIIATTAFGLALAARLLSPTWRIAALIALIAPVVLSLAYIVMRRVVVGKGGVVHVFFVIPWTMLEIRHEVESAVLRSTVPYNDFRCTIPVQHVTRIAGVRADALKRRETFPEA